MVDALCPRRNTCEASYNTHHGIPAGNKSHPISLGLVDCHLHAVRSDVQADAEVAITSAEALHLDTISMEALGKCMPLSILS